MKKRIKRSLHLLLFLMACPFLYLLSFLPPGWAVRVGKWGGRVAFVVDARHRHVTLTNLKAAFPDLRASQRWALARRAFENVGKTFLEIPGLSRQSREEILSRVRYVGADRNEWARAREVGGVLLLTGHIGNWELMALAFGWEEEAQLSVVVRPLDNRYFDRWLTRLRTRSGNRIILKRGALRGVHRALREGNLVGLLMDQGATGRDGVFVDFFGHLAGSSAALALLASRFRVPVHPVYIIRDPTGIGNTVHIGPEIPVLRTGRKRSDLRENTQRFQKTLEGIIREHPEQWFWMHRRWKGSPTVSYGRGKKRRRNRTERRKLGRWC
jgi:Kdo2-lipid IVA lauroyltransferase/acyltransferase